MALSPSKDPHWYFPWEYNSPGTVWKFSYYSVRGNQDCFVDYLWVNFWTVQLYSVVKNSMGHAQITILRLDSYHHSKQWVES